ncbi:MAG: hypothetical protein KDI19_07870, partial [Pseudomonadales bacterium]|nr:hypothetical protein [Pseudomonadales bacterium]
QQRVRDPSRVTLRIVQGAGHFSFLSPFPAHMAGADFPPSTDPPGFDREAFHKTLPPKIEAFLDRELGRSRRLH